MSIQDHNTDTAPHDIAELSGMIHRITYADQASGYTVARVKVSGRRDLVTVVGNLMSPARGETLHMRGVWVMNPKFGSQFKVSHHTKVVPTTVLGIKKYLGSGLIRGIGPKMADRIVDRFGTKTLEVIENEIDRLTEVGGFGLKRIDMIRSAWDEQRDIRDVMVFLQSHGVGSGYAAKIFKTYGRDAISVVTKNPYGLTRDIRGIGFITADRIAEKLGIARESSFRIQAGVIFVLSQLADDGHVYAPRELLISRACEMLAVDAHLVAQALPVIENEREIVIEDIVSKLPSEGNAGKAIYLTQFYRCETQIAGRLTALIRSPKSIRPIDAAKALEWLSRRLDIQLADKQILAIRTAVEQKVMVITGGPGTGKTTLINAILRIYQKLGIKILMAAPTGRAAKRMSDATGFPSATIHRLLAFSPANGGFQKNDRHPLKCDLLVIDEASMVDTPLMHHLLKAIPSRTTLILVGDVFQLPSVGAGNVLNDIIRSGSVPVVTLDRIFRQAQKSRIVINAHRINSGRMPLWDPPAADEPPSDFYFINQEDPEKVLDLILELATHRIPQRFGFDPMLDIQVLTPMHRGIVGSMNLNHRLQENLNPGDGDLVRGGRRFRCGDKVMQIINNYEKEVFNGDIGIICAVDHERHDIVTRFDGREIRYESADLDELALAYAISVHKSQGSEYPVVILPILTQHYMLLQRNLIYTAITRGKKLVVVIGTRKAMAIGIKNDRPQHRFTGLAERLAPTVGTYG
ncbi:MAG: ATP-dependent RecD-like DNA helicase [Desulfobacteraceae bacterium]|nr:ATP-dependent RecD-like DNA helicase [Desulfobacteraceae bacterium]